MEPPAWDDPDFKGGTMVKSALWLVSEVGEGQTFTKEQHRDAFPGVSQADRRMRDLRDFGWVIHTYTDDVTLKPEEQRFVTAGLPVWKPEVRRAASAKAITAKERQATFAADGYQCVVCGIAGGEDYLDAPNASAVLSVTRREVVLPDEVSETQLVTECKRCRAGDDDEPSDVTRVLADVRGLDDSERRRFAHWIERGKRGSTPLDRAWTGFRRLPSEAREEVRKQLRG